MNDRYSITVIKNIRVIKYVTSDNIDLITDYFRLYNTPDYTITIMNRDINRLIARKDKGIQL